MQLRHFLSVVLLVASASSVHAEEANKQSGPIDGLMVGAATLFHLENEYFTPPPQPIKALGGAEVVMKLDSVPSGRNEGSRRGTVYLKWNF